MNRVSLQSIGVIALYLGVVVHDSDVRAQTFSQLTPPTTCPTKTPGYSYVWSATDAAQGVERHYTHTGGIKYHNNQTTERYFIASPKVGGLEFYVTDRDMAVGDSLVMQQGANPSLTISGVNATDQWMAVTSTSLNVPVRMVFASNNSGNGRGFEISQIRYCGTTHGANYLGIVPGRRYQGWVQGTNDTIYMWLTGATAGTQINLVTSNGPGSPTDVDMYARCGALPTPTLYTERSTNAGNEEFLTISNAQCNGSSILYIAINSYSGRGGFNFMASRMNTSADLSIKVAVEGASPTEMATIVSTLRVAARMFYGASDGQALFSAIDVVNVANGSIADSFSSCKVACQAQFGVNCKLCFQRENFAGVSEVPGTARMGIQAWGNPESVYHEWGHAHIGYPDEYGAGYDAEGYAKRNCGHSAMADSWRQTNWCMDLNYPNHNKDPQTSTPEPQDSVWTEGLLLHADPGVTPDWYNFSDHDDVGDTVITTY